MRDLLEVADDDDDEDDEDFQVRFAIANILERAGTSDSQDDFPRRRNQVWGMKVQFLQLLILLLPFQRRGSPSGPTTLATVRRYFREARMSSPALLVI